MGTNNSLPPSSLPESSSDRLDSWKEIAVYLRRDERTVRRWEAEGLPVHRKLHKKQASVYAYRQEIDAWWSSDRGRLEPGGTPPAAPVPAGPTWGRALPSRRVLVPLAVAALAAAVAIVFTVARTRNRVSARPAAGIRSLAVLPLENLSGDASQEYFVDGMTDALITDLAQISDLKVISRTSVMQYKGARKPLPEVARALGVDAVVEGSVVRSGSKVRITAQLIQAPSDEHLWAESFEGSANDILSIQDDVARAITERIQGKLRSQAAQAATHHKPVQPEAYEAYLRGLYFFDKRTATASLKSAEYFRKAIALEPEFAPAYAGLAEALPASYWFNGKPPVETDAEAKAAAKHALGLDERLAEGHTALGGLLSLYDWNWGEAEKELKRALELNPNGALAHERYMMWLLSMGRVSEAVNEAVRAQQLDPLSFFMNRELAHSYYLAGRYDEALEQLKRSQELEPGSRDAVLNWMRWIYERQGKRKEAVELELTEMRDRGSPQSEIDALRKAYALGGWKAYWAKWLQLHSPDKNTTIYEMALAEARVGHADKAWEWMEKDADQKDVFVTWIKVDPLLDNVRSHPGYRRLLRRMEVPD